LESKIAISELIAGLVSLIDGILATTRETPASQAGNQNVNIVEALHIVREGFDQMKAASHDGSYSADDFVAGMNGIMKELRSRRS
jgi:hypothetical protein